MRTLISDKHFAHVAPTEDGFEVELHRNEDARDLLTEVARMETPLLRFEHIQPTLHEIFVQHVGRAATAPRDREVVAHA